MLIDFKSETYTGLRFAAGEEGMSVAAFVSRMCDRFVQQNVNISYEMKAPEDVLDDSTILDIARRVTYSNGKQI